MTARARWAAAVVAAGLLTGSVAARADAPDPATFKGEIDAFVGSIAPASNGAVTWLGSDPYQIRRDGDGLVAIVSHARLGLRLPDAGRLSFDQLEIRRRDQDGGKLIELDVKLPTEATLDDPAAGAIKLALKDATLKSVIEAATGHSRDTNLAIAGGRLDEAKTGSWVRFGPLSLISKLVAEPGGGWRAPMHFDLKQVEFFSAAGGTPAAGTLDELYLSGRSGGPDLAAFEKLRAAIDALRAQGSDLPPEVRLQALWALLPAMPSVFGNLRGVVTVKGLAVRLGTEPMVKLAKADIASEITGLSGKQAALRLTLRQEGLEVAPSLLDAGKVPRRILVDVGVEHLDSQALTQLVAAAGMMAGSGADEAKKQQAAQQLMGAAAQLDPTYRIYDAALDTRDIGLDLTGEATGSPLAPKGYGAAALLKVRGLTDAVRLAAQPLLAEYLPVLEQIAVPDKSADGTPQVDFRLASAPDKLLTVNGNDVTAWFAPAEAKPDAPRLLKPSLPPQQGGDVKAVQRALAAAHIATPRDGIYDAATAGAVARFQKQNGLNVDGVVDAATRRKLGLAEPAPHHGRN